MHRRSLKGALIENKEFNQMVFFGVVFRGTNEEESTGAIYINFPDKEHRNFSVNCEGVSNAINNTIVPNAILACPKRPGKYLIE